MKQWFPFTDYDFYGYLSCGLMLLSAIDYWYSGGQYIFHHDWTFIQGVFLVMLAYITGQIVAMPSSSILENGIARGLMRPPMQVLLAETQGSVEHVVGKYIVGRYYMPLPSGTRTKVLDKAVSDTGLTHAQLLIDPEEIFHPAYVAARASDDARKRMDDFRNQYGFNRNMALSSLIASLLMFDLGRGGNHNAYAFAFFGLLLSVGMFVRFLKFYSAFTAEIVRTYAFK